MIILILFQFRIFYDWMILWLCDSSLLHLSMKSDCKYWKAMLYIIFFFSTGSTYLLKYVQYSFWNVIWLWNIPVNYTETDTAKKKYI